MTTNTIGTIAHFQEHMCFIFVGPSCCLPRELAYCCLEFAGLVCRGRSQSSFTIYC